VEYRPPGSLKTSIPFTDAMLDVLRRVPRFLGLDYVFTTTGKSPVSGFGRLKDRLDKALPEGTEPWIIHDLRCTMSTNMAMQGVLQPDTEALLNHKTGVVSGVAAIYNVYSYTDEKREALEQWNRHLAKMKTGLALALLIVESDQTRSPLANGLSKLRPKSKRLHKNRARHVCFVHMA
jgi:hypothetical protein